MWISLQQPVGSPGCPAVGPQLAGLLPVPANRATHSAGICRLFRGNPTPFFLHSVGTSDPGRGTAKGNSVGTLVEGWLTGASEYRRPGAVAANPRPPEPVSAPGALLQIGG
jgi:hypothetical protein